MAERKIRILIGKCGCDIHERGALTMLNVFRDNGMEVIYAGRFQTEAGVVNAAINEDADVIALSDLTGSRVRICRKVMEMLKEREAEDMHVICGGLMTKEDMAELKAMGVKGCFPTGSPALETVELIKNIVH